MDASNTNTSIASHSQHVSQPSSPAAEATPPWQASQPGLEGRWHGSQPGLTAAGAGVGAGAGLHEFRSLLEAAQRIAGSATFSSTDEAWIDQEHSDPRIRRSRGIDELRQRLSLTRQYSGRPHVPGEDSGSEEGGGDYHDHHNGQEETDETQGIRAAVLGMASRREGEHEEVAVPPRSRSISPTRRDDDGDSSDNFASDNVGRTNGNGAYFEAEQARHEQAQTTTEMQSDAAPGDRDGEGADRRPESLRRAVSVARDLRSHQQYRRLRDELLSTATETPPQHLTTHLLPAEQSLDDWPSLYNDAQETGTTPATRNRSSSVRRWRPAERLQDYASSHHRRESANESHPTWQEPAVGPPRPSTRYASSSDRTASPLDPTWTRPAPPRPLDREFGDHNDIVTRVERALQEYRIARRALRVGHDDAPTRSLDRPAALANASARTLGYRSTNDTRRERVRSDGTEVSPPNTRGPSSFTSWDEVRRDDSIRQRLRDQARDRRRRVVSSMLEQETSIATGPLFEGANSSIRGDYDDTDRWHQRTRRLMESARQADVRANSKDMKQAKAALQYLAQLRDPEVTRVKAWTLASKLGLHNWSLHDDFPDNLPMSLNDLPEPAFCSWLEPGMTWSGTQSADESEERVKGERRRAYREVLLRSNEERERVVMATRQNESFRTRMRQTRDPLERTLIPDDNRDALTIARDSMEVLEDAERNLSSMLERSERLLRENEIQLQQNRERLQETDARLQRLQTGSWDLSDVAAVPGLSEFMQTKEDWNVKVVLHSIDWDNMTLTGTMTASHMRRGLRADVEGDEGTSDQNDDTSMDSFFTGEIVDFLSHGLDTLSSTDRGSTASSGHKADQDDWKTGGPETDLTYWAGIGPFKQEIDQVIAAREAVVVSEWLGDQQQDAVKPAVLANGDNMDNCDNDTNGTDDNTTSKKDQHQPEAPSVSVLTNDEKYELKLKTIHRLLTDTTWLNDNINSQGWILMRWKERCFVSPGTDPNPEPTRPWIPNRPGLNTRSVAISTARSALHTTRSTNSQAGVHNIYTTNAEEREEIQGSTGGRISHQPTWGLTISGFYYVALHRQTGHIEAMYYDCGSAPFQRLGMCPALTTSMAPERVGISGYGNSMDIDTGESMCKEKEQEQEKSKLGTSIGMLGGLRTDFSLVEFR